MPVVILYSCTKIKKLYTHCNPKLTFFFLFYNRRIGVGIFLDPAFGQSKIKKPNTSSFATATVFGLIKGNLFC